MTGYADVRHAYTRSSVLTAPPERLVLMLYDGAIRSLNQAAEAMQFENASRAREGLRRAEAIIDELNLCLDMSYGQISEPLRAIYLFCKRHLLESSLRQDPDGVRTVASLLTELREAWEQAAAHAPVQPAAAES